MGNNKKILAALAACILSVLMLLFYFGRNLFIERKLEAIAKLHDEEKEYDEVLGKIDTNVEPLIALKNVFGEGRVYIRHYQSGFKNPIFVWEGQYKDNYTVQYEILLMRTDDGFLDFMPESKGVGHLLENVTRIRLPDGRSKITHGNYHEFTLADLRLWEKNPKAIEALCVRSKSIQGDRQNADTLESSKETER
jgi:hypothetical protein